MPQLRIALNDSSLFRRAFPLFSLIFMMSTGSVSTLAQSSSAPAKVFPGVWCFRLGTPEKITPVSTRHFPPAQDALVALNSVSSCPISVTGTSTSRGYLLTLPLEAQELIYGLGLQLQSFEQRSHKKTLRVNADPSMDTGDSHAPVPFYVTSRGYGVFVDTARYATFYLGNKVRAKPHALDRKSEGAGHDGWNGVPTYVQKGLDNQSEVLIEIPGAAGVDVYIFAGPSLREAVQRYNLFSGGGALPPRWGLGFWYRAQTDFDQDDILKLAAEFRERKIPCDVIGLEPHWQSHSYSCSFLWSTRFQKPDAMLQQLTQQGFRVNLWEHAFTHPSSPIYPALLPYAGDHEVWGGLVPDFIMPEGREIFADHHDKTHVALGVSGYKLDECDNSDFTGNWSFPELSHFPSGADGEQMHTLFGLRYQDAILSIFEKREKRTYGLVRSSGALAAPYPFVLYSDLYQHSQFVHGVAQASFSGLLWTPEVRDARSPEELIRRLQSAVMSPLAMVNAWYLSNPPWKQVDRQANNDGEFASGWERVEEECRKLIELRMRFVPYLHAAFVRYHRDGLPPFRALVMDYPDDPEVGSLSDEYLVGDSLLVAPIIVSDHDQGSETAALGAKGSTKRRVYLPEGEWFDFWTGEHYLGKQHLDLEIALERIPIFVKAGTILPLAQPTQSTDDPAAWILEARVFGDGARETRLYEDDGSANPRLTEVNLNWNPATETGRFSRSAPSNGPSYSISKWTQVR